MSKNNESEDLFNFTNKPSTNILTDTDQPLDKINVKQEMVTPSKKPPKKNQSNNVNDEESIDLIIPSNSSSVFAIPNETDEIIFVEDSESFFNFPNKQLDSMIGEHDDGESEQNESIPRPRMEYGTPVRKKKDKAALPGFECPECAPVCTIVHVHCTYSIHIFALLLKSQCYCYYFIFTPVLPTRWRLDD